MSAVSNTSPIDYLVLISHIEILERLYGHVIIPPAVLTELRHQGSPEAVQKWALTPPPWIEVRAPSRVDVAIDIGPGETEAIALAMELRPVQILLDDQKARRYAFERELPVAGTLGVPQAASAAGLLEISAAISHLKRTNFRMSERVIQRLRMGRPLR